MPKLLTAAADRFADGAEQHGDMTVAAMRIV
jgi:hypothetical protein